MRFPHHVSLTLLFAGCGFAQVSPSQSHGTLHIRVVQHKSEFKYQNGARLDQGRYVAMDEPGTREARVRVRPGPHEVAFSSIADRYELRDEKQQVTKSHCVGVTCSTVPDSETQTRLVPARDAECSRVLKLDVAKDGEALALFVVGPEGTCEACAPDYVDASECAANETTSSR